MRILFALKKWCYIDKVPCLSTHMVYTVHTLQIQKTFIILLSYMEYSSNNLVCIVKKVL